MRACIVLLAADDYSNATIARRLNMHDTLVPAGDQALPRPAPGGRLFFKPGGKILVAGGSRDLNLSTFAWDAERIRSSTGETPRV
jgi:hypothetical protein